MQRAATTRGRIRAHLVFGTWTMCQNLLPELQLSLCPMAAFALASLQLFDIASHATEEAGRDSVLSM